MASSLQLVCAALVLLGVIWVLFIYPLFFSPLSPIPSAHPLAKVTSAWIFWIRYKRSEIAAIHAAHQRYGPIVRLGPNEISVNCVKGGIQTVYSGGFEKGIPQGNWYHFFSNFDGVDNMFSMARNKPHSARKRMLSNIYSKSSLQASPVMTAVTASLINQRFVPMLNEAAKSRASINMCAAFAGITMDMVTGYLFGLAASSDFTTDIEQRDRFLGLYISRQDFGYWAQEWPELSSWLSKAGWDLTPRHVYEANSQIDAWALKMCDAAEISLERSRAVDDKPGISTADFPTVYAQLKSAMSKQVTSTSQEKQASTQRLEIASELLDHLAAGFDTSGITLTFLAQHLSYRHNAQIVERLRAELRGLPTDPATGLPSAKVLDSAPYLQAVLQEILRLHAAIPGSQPRTTPDIGGGSTLGENGEYTGIPGGVRISAQAWSLHRNADVFPEPETYEPERWLVERDGTVEYSPTSEMNRWFWAFGSGGRMCVGSNLAIYQMKYIIYGVWANFDTIIVDESGCVQKDSYTAPPEGHSLMLRLEAAP